MRVQVLCIFAILLLEAQGQRRVCRKLGDCLNGIERKAEECASMVQRRMQRELKKPSTLPCHKRMWRTMHGMVNSSIGETAQTIQCIDDKMKGRILPFENARTRRRCVSILNNAGTSTPRFPGSQRITSAVRQFLSKTMPSAKRVQKCLVSLIEQRFKCFPLLKCCTAYESCEYEENIPPVAQKIKKIINEMKGFQNCRGRG